MNRSCVLLPQVAREREKGRGRRGGDEMRRVEGERKGEEREKREKGRR